MGTYLIDFEELHLTLFVDFDCISTDMRTKLPDSGIDLGSMEDGMEDVI